MMKIIKRIMIPISILSMMTIHTLALAQEPIPHHKIAFNLDTNTQENFGTEAAIVFRQVIQAPGVPWLQIHFSDYNLGGQSFVTLTSLQDGGQQRLDARSLPLWRNASAYFNGDAVELKLTVASGEKNIFVQIKEITVGDWVGQIKALQTENIEPKEICGTTDDRVASSHAGVGRIMPIGCTGWMISNGGNLTAGHCVTTTTQTLQFNVPASQDDGTPVNPPPQDQYPITAYTDSSSGGEGNDWAVFETGVNPHGQTAFERQGAFFRMNRDRTPIIVREIGYGVDGPPPLFGDPPGPRNADSQTQQAHTGPFVSETIVAPNDVEIRYVVDDENANSGSPVIDIGIPGDVTVGIATHAGCTSTGGSNAGTGFEHDDLENAIQTFPGPNIEYVDNGHPIAIEDGTVFRPFDTVTEALTNATSGATISIVSGSYNETLTLGADGKALFLVAPVGPVTIGQ